VVFCFRYSISKRADGVLALFPIVLLNICFNIMLVSSVPGRFLALFSTLLEIVFGNLPQLQADFAPVASGCLQYLMRTSVSILLGQSTAAPPPGLIFVFPWGKGVFALKSTRHPRLPSPRMDRGQCLILHSFPDVA
jgi:hypothetical protein